MKKICIIAKLLMDSGTHILREQIQELQKIPNKPNTIYTEFKATEKENNLLSCNIAMTQKQSTATSSIHYKISDLT